jgi:hypothetical protein
MISAPSNNFEVGRFDSATTRGRSFTSYSDFDISLTQARCPQSSTTTSDGSGERYKRDHFSNQHSCSHLGMLFLIRETTGIKDRVKSMKGQPNQHPETNPAISLQRHYTVP